METGERSREDLMKVFLRRYREIRASCTETMLERIKMQREYPDSFEWWQRFMQDKDPDDVIDDMMKTSENTGRILFEIDNAIDEYADIAKKEGLLSWRQYDTIYSLYFSSQKIVVRDIAKKFGVKKSTIYDDVKEGRKRLTAILFGNKDANA